MIEVKITMYCSYIKHLNPWPLVKPMALRQPYSQTFSLMLLVVLISRRKKARISDMTPMTITQMLKTSMAIVTASRASFLSSKMVL